MSFLHEQVVVSGSNIHTAGVQWLLVLDINDLKPGYVLKQPREQIVGVTASMLYNEQRYLEVTRQFREQPGESGKPAP